MPVSWWKVCRLPHLGYRCRVISSLRVPTGLDKKSDLKALMDAIDKTDSKSDRQSAKDADSTDILVKFAIRM